MIMMIWLLFIFALFLLMSGVREGFTNAQGIEGEKRDVICPAGMTLNMSLRKCTSPNDTGTITQPVCPAGYTDTGRGICLKGVDEVPKSCSSGTTSNFRGGCVLPNAFPTCPDGFSLQAHNDSPICFKPNASSGGTGGTTTGGTTTTTYGPNAGRNRQVFGPVFTSKGQASSYDGAGDSSTTNKYPELLGGMPDSSTRIEGAGITTPSKNWALTQNGSLPDSKSLGTDENAKFFPTSRVPGDMDLIPDPYRLSRNFSTASYSSKTEPVPFLTDFSAFLK